MQTNDIPLAPRLDRGVYVADGWGIKVHVRHRHLIVEDGVGPERRIHRFHKATTNLKRLVILGTTGYITFEAVRWMADARTAYIHLDADGKLLATSEIRGVDHTKLRRAQALAADNQTGINISRRVLEEKIRGQLRVAEHLPEPDDARSEIAGQLELLDGATTCSELVVIEAEAAIAYWQAWRTVPIQFPKSDLERVADHWRTFGTRNSPITRSNRKAANPANAILNYLYALLEAETIIGCATVGLDPGLGIIHTDQPHRANMALDLMEAARPEVDAYLLDLLRSYRFRASDFRETERGVCRVSSELARHLAPTAAIWRERLAPTIEHVAAMLCPAPRGTRPSTPLTQRNRRAGRSRQRKSESMSQSSRMPTPIGKLR